MSIPVSKMYVIHLDFKSKTIQVAALSEIGEEFLDSGRTDGDPLWTDWSNPMSAGELAERIEFALSQKTKET